MLAEKLFELKSFKRQYEALMILSVCKSIPNIEWEFKKNSLLEKIDWNNMISIASALSYSKKNNHLDAALRIAQTVLSEDSTLAHQKEAAAVILISLSNNSAVELAIKRGFISKDFRNGLPFSIKLQNYKLLFENSILLNENAVLLNRFQKEVYSCYETNDAISISAPTSVGKSYILCNIIIEELSKSNKNIVYLVPTRALISQVENDLREFISTYDLLKVNISTVPQNGDLSDASNILVFTQERLHWFLTLKLHKNKVNI